MDYKKAGVDIVKANKIIDDLKSKIKETFRTEVISDIGGFSGLFDIVQGKYNDPVLVASVDGVGTKLKLAFLAGKHFTIGIDLVAMCVNDIIVCGAEPLFMLDYFATSQLEEKVIKEVIAGIVEGCKLANCSLIGGETAEMPSFYKIGEYDLAGFAVGIIEKDKIIDGSSISIGDKIIGISSSGVHSNGFSLIRKIFLENYKFNLNEKLEGLDKPLIDVLLEPTRIYVYPVLKIIKNFNIKGMAHITGGGIIENVKRILSDRLKAIIDCSAWEVPSIFKIIKKYGNIDEIEMFRVFNNGIGYVIIVDKEEVEDLTQFLNNLNFKSYLIGEITSRKEGEPKVELKSFINSFK